MPPRPPSASTTWLPLTATKNRHGSPFRHVSGRRHRRLTKPTQRSSRGKHHIHTGCCGRAGPEPANRPEPCWASATHSGSARNQNQLPSPRRSAVKVPSHPTTQCYHIPPNLSTPEDALRRPAARPGTALARCAPPPGGRALTRALGTNRAALLPAPRAGPPPQPDRPRPAPRGRPCPLHGR